MKRTVDNSFTKLDEDLNLAPFVRQKAQTLHNTIRDDLTEAGLIAGGFLQGSFARKTMLKPLKDVDIVCPLPAYVWELLSGPDGPGKAMESFKAPIVDRWPDVQFDVGDEPAGKALRLTLRGVDFTSTSCRPSTPTTTTSSSVTDSREPGSRATRASS